MFGKN